MSAKKPPRLAGLGRRKKLVVVCLAIACALIAVVLVTVMGVLGDGLNTAFGNIKGSLETTATP